MKRHSPVALVDVCGRESRRQLHDSVSACVRVYYVLGWGCWGRQYGTQRKGVGVGVKGRVGRGL